MIKLDITNKVRYDECEDKDGKFIQLLYKKVAIAEIRVYPGWFEGKKIKEVFKVFYCEDHPIDYVWLNKKLKKKKYNATMNRGIWYPTGPLIQAQN